MSKEKEKTQQQKMNTAQVADVIIKWSDSRIQRYIEKVSAMYKISKNDLRTMLATVDDIAPPTPSPATTPPPDTIAAVSGNVAKMKKKELQELCVQKGLNKTGNKKELQARLASAAIQPENPPPPARSTKSKKKINVIDADGEVPDTIRLKRSPHGNFVFKGLVVDPMTQVVVGREEDDGTVSELNESDIEKCNKYRIDFEPPNNMDIQDNDEEDDNETVIVEEESGDDDEDELVDEEVEYVYE